MVSYDETLTGGMTKVRKWDPPHIREMVEMTKIEQRVSNLEAQIDALINTGVMQGQRLDEAFLRIGELELAWVGTSEGPDDDPDPAPVPAPTPGYQKFITASPQPTTPEREITLTADQHTLTPQSGDRIDLDGLHVDVIGIGWGVGNITIVNGSVGSVMCWYADGELPRRIHLENLSMDQLYAHAHDLFVKDCRIHNLGDGAGGDGYAVWASLFQPTPPLGSEPARVIMRQRYVDCSFISDDPNAANGCVRLQDIQDVEFRACTFDSDTHRGLRLHGWCNRVLVRECDISVNSDSPLGGLYAGPYVDGGQGRIQNVQFLNCRIADSFQISPDSPDQVDASTIWVNGCTLINCYPENINEAESDWVRA